MNRNQYSPDCANTKQFIETWNRLRSNVLVAQELGIHTRNVQQRRKRLADKGIKLLDPAWANGLQKQQYERQQNKKLYKARLPFELKEGYVFIGSDSHYLPGVISTAHRAFVHLCKELRPKAVIKNGDILDFPRISRFPPIGWESRPEVVNEIEWTQERLAEIEDAAKGATKFWPLGNHCSRFAIRLATQAPEYANVRGFQLKDHFPRWQPCWALWINDDTVVKHRFRGGMHAARNNTLHAGKHIFTGHLHSLKVQPFTDYNGTRFGVDCGSLADPEGDQFLDYTEDNPKDWRSGFIICHYWRGQLLWPQIVHVLDEEEGWVDYNGTPIRV